MSKNNMTWYQLSIDLLQFREKARYDEAYSSNSPVVLYDRSTGEEYKCDLCIMDEDVGSPKLVLMFNTDELEDV
jgi:hypothetical protein